MFESCFFCTLTRCVRAWQRSGISSCWRNEVNANIEYHHDCMYLFHLLYGYHVNIGLKLSNSRV